MQKLRVRKGCMFRCACEPPTLATVEGGSATRFLSGVRVRRHFGDRQRMRLLAAAFSQRMAAADVDRRASAQVGQREVAAPVAAEGRAQQREQGLVLVDRQKLPIAKGPATRREHETHDAYF
jgi:cyanophycinase-like exopeptidase